MKYTRCPRILRDKINLCTNISRPRLVKPTQITEPRTYKIYNSASTLMKIMKVCNKTSRLDQRQTSPRSTASCNLGIGKMACILRHRTIDTLEIPFPLTWVLISVNLKQKYKLNERIPMKELDKLSRS